MSWEITKVMYLILILIFGIVKSCGEILKILYFISFL